jgi:hypothetical protein
LRGCLEVRATCKWEQKVDGQRLVAQAARGCKLSPQVVGS